MDTKYVIIDTSEIDKINFNEVLESNSDTLRMSNDNKTFVKYNGEMPSSIKNLKTKSIEYNNIQMLDILSKSNWLYEISGSIKIN